MVRIADYPELSWKQILQVLENNGFVEKENNDRHYVHLQKDLKNVRILKVEKIPRLFLHYIINETKIPIEDFIG
jgi:predicted RNA binding protein YcfA (HicA-like mRNA interferase family)